MHIGLFVRMETPDGDPYGATLLNHAVAGNSFVIAEYLVDQGADVNLVVDFCGGRNVVHLACMFPDRLEMLRLFVTRGKADIKLTTTTMKHSCIWQCITFYILTYAMLSFCYHIITRQYFHQASIGISIYI